MLRNDAQEQISLDVGVPGPDDLERPLLALPQNGKEI